MTECLGTTSYPHRSYFTLPPFAETPEAAGWLPPGRAGRGEVPLPEGRWAPRGQAATHAPRRKDSAGMNERTGSEGTRPSSGKRTKMSVPRATATACLNNDRSVAKGARPQDPGVWRAATPTDNRRATNCAGASFHHPTPHPAREGPRPGPARPAPCPLAPPLCRRAIWRCARRRVLCTGLGCCSSEIPSPRYRRLALVWPGPLGVHGRAFWAKPPLRAPAWQPRWPSSPSSQAPIFPSRGRVPAPRFPPAQAAPKAERP